MNAVAVTEPDFGSDVAAIVTAATRTDGGWLVNGVKTWCTFAARADVLMLLARTDPDRSKAHRGLSLFVVEKPRGDGEGFVFTQDPGVRRPRRPSGADGGSAHRHPRVPGHALLRDRLRELVRPRRQPRRAATTAWAGASTPRWRASRTVVSRPRPAPSGSCRPPTRRPRDVRRQPRRLRPAHRRVPAHPGQADPHGGAHPGGPPVRVPSCPAHGQGRRNPRGVDAQGLRVPGRGMGDARGHADPRRAWATPRNSP